VDFSCHAIASLTFNSTRYPPLLIV